MSEPTASERRSSEPEEHTHLEDVDAGSGCTEIWEQLSERRESAEE